jgi:hypothetical protein
MRVDPAGDQDPSGAAERRFRPCVVPSNRSLMRLHVSDKSDVTLATVTLERLDVLQRNLVSHKAEIRPGMWPPAIETEGARR